MAGLSEELKEGWHLISKDEGMSLAMIQLTAMATLMLVIGMLAPGLATRVLGVAAEDAAFILSPAGLGVLAGAVLLPRMAPRIGKERSINTGLLIQAAAFFLLAVARPIDLFLGPLLAPFGAGRVLPNASGSVGAIMLLALITGWAFAMVVIPAQTILQERAPIHTRGRVFAIQIAFGNVASLLPLLFLGVLADLVGIPAVVVLLGLIVFAIGLYSVRQTRDLPGGPIWIPFRRPGAHEMGGAGQDVRAAKPPQG